MGTIDNSEDVTIMLDVHDYHPHLVNHNCANLAGMFFEGDEVDNCTGLTT